MRRLILHRMPALNNIARLPWIKGNIWKREHAPVMPPHNLEAPANIVPPSISGVAAVGSVLTCTPGVWTGNPSPAKTYEWMVGNSPIVGAEGLTYTVQAGAAGNPIKIREIATNSEGIHSVFSNVIAIP